LLACLISYELAWNGREIEREIAVMFEFWQTPEESIDATSKSCFALCKAEMNPCQPFFPVADSTGRKMDVRASFAPATKVALLWKICATSAALFTVVYTWVEASTPSFYLAYLTYWSLVVAAFYLFSSLVKTCRSEHLQQPPDEAPWQIAFTWLLFSIAAHAEFFVTILYWVLVYNPDNSLTYSNVMPHGGMLVLVWVDGFVINRIPCRWQHWWGAVVPFEAAWIFWSVLHSTLFDIGNPDANDGDDNDDAIYEAFDWKGDPGYCVILSLLVLFVAGPALYLVMWLWSWYKWPFCCRTNRRRYLDASAYPKRDENRPSADVESVSIWDKFW
jgi:hypothetical protein